MESPRIPRRTYLLPLAALATMAFIRYVFENKLAHWVDIHMRLLIELGLAFWCGLILQDWYNKESWLWQNWYALNRTFVIDWVNTPGKNTPTMEWLELTADIRLLKSVKSATFTIRVHSCINLSHARRVFVLSHFERGSLPVGHHEKHVLATIPIKRYDDKAMENQYWGQRYLDGGAIDEGLTVFTDGGAENVIEIEAQSGWRKQREYVFVVSRSNHPHHDRVFTVYGQSRFGLRLQPTITYAL